MHLLPPPLPLLNDKLYDLTFIVHVLAELLEKMGYRVPIHLFREIITQHKTILSMKEKFRHIHIYYYNLMEFETSLKMD